MKQQPEITPEMVARACGVPLATAHELIRIANKQMKNCKHCGQINASDAKYCALCRRKFPAQPALKKEKPFVYKGEEMKNQIIRAES